MAGDVWKYARDCYGPSHLRAPTVDLQDLSLQLAASHSPTGRPRVTVRGGSWLCAPEFHLRYLPEARQRHEPRLNSDQSGFRTVLREARP